MFMPVHVRKRGDRLEPATPASFFTGDSAAKIPGSLLDLSGCYSPRKLRQPRRWILMAKSHWQFPGSCQPQTPVRVPRFTCKGNATVTFNGSGLLPLDLHGK